ncbi:hypothetical protein QQ045_025284 [Rhodiola kirilowii]
MSLRSALAESNRGEKASSHLQVLDPHLILATDSPFRELLAEFRGIKLQDANEEKIKNDIKRWAKAVASAAAASATASCF